MRRGDIWWATLPPPAGSGPGGRRPVIIAQADHVTKSHIRTVIIIVALTSNLSLARYAGNVLLPAHLSSLERDSVANVSQVLTVDRTLLTEYVATLPNSLMDEVDEGLRLVFDLF